CFLEHFQGFLQLTDVNTGVRFVTTDIDRFGIFRAAQLTHYILWKIDQYRTGSSCAGNIKGFFDNTSQIFTSPYSNAVFGNTSGNAYDVYFLEGIISNQVSGYLAGEAYQGNTVVIGGGESCHQVAGSGTAGYQTDTYFSCGSCISVCFMHQRLFVPGKYDVNAALFVKFIADVDGAGSRVSEENFYALFF